MHFGFPWGPWGFTINKFRGKHLAAHCRPGSLAGNASQPCYDDTHAMGVASCRGFAKLEAPVTWRKPGSWAGKDCNES